MKKILIAAVAISIAAISNAASVGWSSGTFTGGFKGPTDAKMTSSDAFTMVVSVYSDSLGSTLVTTSTDTAANGGGAFTGTIANLTADTDYWVKAIITGKDTAGKAWTREAALSAIHTPLQGEPTLAFIDGSNFVVAEPKWGAWTSAAPEPTSGIMLLLGVGLMALKRKRT